jgi:peptide/nickel transport system substrate-binding protein
MRNENGRILVTQKLHTPARRVWLSGMVILMVLALFAAACGDDAEETTTTAAGSTTTAAPAGRSIVIALAEEPRNLSSWNAYSNDGHPVLRNITEALLNRDPVTNELVPELALSYSQVDENTWQFQLREGVTFHDGSPFNAENAAFSINFVLAEENGFPMRQFFGSQVTAEAVSEYVLNVSTVDPDPILPLRLYFCTIPSAKAIQDSPETYESNPVGTGPYKLKEWSRGQYVDIVANEDWWGRDDPAAAYGSNELITEARFIFRSESTVRAALLDTGEADFARFLNPEDCENAPQCEGSPTVETVIFRMDTVNPLLSDIRIRQAIAFAIDKSAIMNDIMGGGELANQIVSSSALGHNDSLEPYPFDIAAATALVAEAAADGVDVTAPILVAARTGFPNRGDETIQLVGEALRSIGLTGVTTQMFETVDFEEMWSQTGYANTSPDRGLIGLNQHGNELMDYAASMGYYTCNGQVSVLCDEDLEALVADAIQKSGDERDQALQAVAAYVHELYYIVPIGYPIFYHGLVEGLNWTPRMDGFILLKEMTSSS